MMDTSHDAPLSTSDLAAPSQTPDAAATPDAGENAPASEGARDEPLLALNDLEGFRRRWDEVQTSFVDEPRAAVARADELVAGLMQQLADTFAKERSHLESQWDRGEEVSTEELRIALQRYRGFFTRLLHT